MSFIVIYEFNNSKHLLCNESSVLANAIHVNMFENKVHLMEFFNPFIEGLKRYSPGNAYVSATISMMTLRPIAIPALATPDSITPYLVDRVIRKVQGGPLLKKMIGTLVVSSIIGDSVIDIWKECLLQANSLPS